MANSVYFNGSVITVPGVYSAIDTSGIETKPSAADDAKTLAIIGECTGGEPGAVQFFSEPKAARRVLKSGELLKACEKAWNPVSATKEGVDIGGANVIACIRTNAATKSELKLFTLGNFTKPQIIFQSKDWGTNTNYRLKIQDGSISGTKKIVINDQINDVYETFDEIGKAFYMSYTGDQPYAELNITTDEQGTLTLWTKIGANAESAIIDINLTLNPEVFKSMRSLIYELQSYENYNVVSATRYNTHLSVADLDLMINKNIKSVEGSTVPVTAIFADLADTLATTSRFIEVTNFDRTQGDFQNIEDYVFLTGGSEGISPSSWIQFFDALSNFNIDYVVPLTSDESIHAELASHLQECSGIMGHERRGVVGGNVGESIKDSIQRAHNLNYDRIQVVHGGFYDVDSSNQLRLYPPYILAAQHAGRAAFLPEGESATHDTYRMSAPEYQLTAEEITQLLQGGCLAFEYVLSGNSISSSYVRLVQDLTTDLMNSDAVHLERATGQLADSINKEIRKKLDKLLTGKRATRSDVVSATNAVHSILQNRVRNGYILSYRGVYVTNYQGTTTVDYSVAAAEPNNFTLITAHYYSQAISV